MPFLQKKSVINVPDNISMDFIIDILINNGYEKLNLRKNVLSISPYVRIRLKNNILTVENTILILFVLFPFFWLFLPITIPLAIRCIKNRRRIIRIICSSLLQLNP